MKKSILSIAIGLACMSAPLEAQAQPVISQPAPGQTYSFPDDGQQSQNPNMNQDQPQYDPYAQPPGQAAPPIPQYVPPGQQAPPDYSQQQYQQNPNPALPQYQQAQPYQYQPGQQPGYPPQQYAPGYPAPGQQYQPQAAPYNGYQGQQQADPSSQDPNVKALRQLRRIRRDLNQAGPDPTGHRAQATQLLDQAIQELRAASSQQGAPPE